MNLAVNLLSGNGLLNPLQAEGTIIPPLFPLLIAPFIGIFNTIYSFFVFQYILYGVNALILFYLTRKVFQEKTNACSWFAVLLYIFNPVLLKNGPQFLETGTVYTFFILMITWSLIDLYDSTMRKKGTNRAFIISIAAITLSLFLQPQMLFMLPIMLIVALILLRKRLLTGKSLLLSILIPVLLFGANMIHNHIIHGEPVMLDNVSGCSCILPIIHTRTSSFPLGKILMMWWSPIILRWIICPFQKKFNFTGACDSFYSFRA